MNTESSEKKLSVLFVNVTGNSRLQEKLGSAEAHRAADRCLKRVERAVEAFGGRVVKTVNNESMIVFPSADNALHAALEMQQRVADLPPISGIKLAVRAGFSFGPVVEVAADYVGEAVTVAALLTGMAEPAQVLTTDEGVAALSPMLKCATRKINLPHAKNTLSRAGFFEIVAPDFSVPLAASAGHAHVTNPHSGDATSVPRLRLIHAGRAIVLDGQQTAITMGRGSECDVLVQDRRASRNHARIERLSDRFILSDMSTNGTFVTLAGEPEVRLRRGECALVGKGVISFASPAASEGADFAEFEQLPPE